jgi:hypothetical protein
MRTQAIRNMTDTSGCHSSVCTSRMALVKEFQEWGEMSRACGGECGLEGELAGAWGGGATVLGGERSERPGQRAGS